MKTLLILSLLSLSTAGLAHAGDAVHGQKVFAGECSVCHSTEAGKNKVGPSLHAVVGRPAASIDGFSYSDGMRASGLRWTEENLERYLSNPAATVPGCRMPYPGLKNDSKRSDLIAFLATQK